jgi:hypothetical protein
VIIPDKNSFSQRSFQIGLICNGWSQLRISISRQSGIRFRKSQVMKNCRHFPDSKSSLRLTCYNIFRLISSHILRLPFILWCRGLWKFPDSWPDRWVWREVYQHLKLDHLFFVVFMNSSTVALLVIIKVVLIGVPYIFSWNPCQSPGNQNTVSHHCGPVLILGQIMWDLWWTKWHWNRFYPTCSTSVSLANSHSSNWLIVMSSTVYSLNIDRVIKR